MQKNASDFLDLRGAAQHYPLSRRKLWQLVRDRRLRAYRLDGKLILRRTDIEKVLTASPV